MRKSYGMKKYGSKSTSSFPYLRSSSRKSVKFSSSDKMLLGSQEKNKSKSILQLLRMKPLKSILKVKNSDRSSSFENIQDNASSEESLNHFYELFSTKNSTNSIDEFQRSNRERIRIMINSNNNKNNSTNQLKFDFQELNLNDNLKESLNNNQQIFS